MKTFKTTPCKLADREERGAAIILTLFFILLVSILVVAFLLSMRVDKLSTQSYSQSIRAQEIAKGATEEVLSDLMMEINAGSRPETGYVVNGRRVYVPTSFLSSQPARIGYAWGTANGAYSLDVTNNDGKIPTSLIRVSRADTNGITFASYFPATTNLGLITYTNYDVTKLPPQRASATSTKTAPIAGRAISGERWNMPYLMGTNVPSTFTNSPPDWIYYTRSGSHVFNNTSSDLANMAPNKDLNQTNTVIGRYAYVIYDEGSLLDINSVGYPSTATSPSGTNKVDLAIRGKSSPIYAALSSLPGLSGKANELNNLIAWRNKGSLASATPPGDFYSASTNMVNTGFMEVKSDDSPILSRQDLINYFTNKIGTKAPLAYIGTFSRCLAAPSAKPIKPFNDYNQSGAKDATASPLPAEDFSSIDYDADSNKTASANRDLANVRFSGTATVIHYDDNGNIVQTKAPNGDIVLSYTVKAGDPLLQSRFSLARLDWLKDGNPNTGNGPSVTKAAAIKACFGLDWNFPGGAAGSSKTANGGNKCWNYIGSEPTSSIGNPPGKIKTLAEVADDGREPNFFGLLKAAILSGSLGKGAGPAAFQNGGYVPNPIFDFNKDFQWQGGDDSIHNIHFGPVGFFSHTLGPGSTTPAPARISDMQIMRIGANIIDQYDADSWPTAIWFKYSWDALPGSPAGNIGQADPATGSSYSPKFGPVTMAYGIENLPYLSGIQEIIAAPADNKLAGWRQPVLYNPHQPPAQTLQNRPTSYQIRAYGSGMTGFQDVDAATYTLGISPVVQFFGTNSNTEASAIGTLEFDVNFASADAPAARSFYDKPVLLTFDAITGVTASSPFAGNMATSTLPYYNSPDGNITTAGAIPSYVYPNHFIAFSMGVTDPNTPIPASPAGRNSAQGPFYKNMGIEAKGWARPPDNANTYVLGWKDTTSGGFHPYSYLSGAFTYEWQSMNGSNPNVLGSVKPLGRSWIQEDPRTERFSLGRDIQGGDFPTTMSVTWKDSGYGVWAPAGRPGGPDTSLGFFGSETSVTGTYPQADTRGKNGAYTYWRGDWQINKVGGVPGEPGRNWNLNYYKDPDGIVRPGDGYYGTYNTTGDGFMNYLSTPSPNSPVPPGDNGAAAVTTHGRRPIILNRPFRSVGELSYVFRDQPFKTLDFFTDMSADSALLDVFCLSDAARVQSDKILSITAGRVNPNAASTSVLTALLKGGAKKEFAAYDLGGTVATPTDDAKQIAAQIAGQIMTVSTYIPATGYQEFIPKLVAAVRNSAAAAPSDKVNKAYLEAPIRALAESTQFRTWNLMIDLFAQSGRMSSGATNLSQFSVQAEYHVWVHVAIDRFTGEIIARQWEPVYE